MTPPRSAWRLALAGVLLGSAAVVALYFDGFAGFVSVWSSTVAYRFLFLVPVVALYFIWLRLPEIAALCPRPTVLGLVYGAPFGMLWLVAQATQLSIAAQVAAVGMLQAVFLTVLGWQICRRLLFPLLLLWLMVPFGDLLTPALIELTTALTIGGLKLAGMEAVADGNLLVAGGARYAIIQECTGLDFLLGNLLISLAYANLMYGSFRKKVLYVLAGVAVAIFANNLRTTTVVLITAGGIDLAANHEAYGWFLFLCAMLLQMAVGLRYRDVLAAPASAPGDAAGTRPDAPSPMTAAATATATVAAVIGIVVLASLAPAYALLALAPVAESVATPAAVRLCLPPSVLAATSEPVNADAWHPVFPAAGARVHRVLAIGDRAVDVFVAYYWRQGPASKLIGSGNRLHDGTDWRYLASGTDTAEVAGRPVAVATERLAGDFGQRRLVWYWYWVDGQFSNRPWHAKLLSARAALSGGDQRSAVIAVAADEAGDATRGILQAALDELPGIADALNSATRGDAPGRVCP